MAAARVVELKTGPSILVRAVWYLLIGWWLTGILMFFTWVAAITVVGLPLAFWLVNRIPTVLTLRPRRVEYGMFTGADGVTRYQRLRTEQNPWWVRLVYFLLVGWWVSAAAMFLSYFLMLTIIGIPIGLMIVNRLPFIFSLHRGYA